MSDNNTETKKELTQEEKVEFLKVIFSTLDVDQKMIFTQWCHEECEKGGGELLAEKWQGVNDSFNKMVAEGYDKFVGAAKYVYEKGNEAFKVRDEDAVKNNTSEELDKDDSPSFFS